MGKHVTVLEHLKDGGAIRARMRQDDGDGAVYEARLNKTINNTTTRLAIRIITAVALNMGA